MEYPQEASPHTTQTSALGLHSLAPSANPPPTPRVPKAPGSSQHSGPRGRRTYEAVATKSPPSATRIESSGSEASSCSTSRMGLMSF